MDQGSLVQYLKCSVAQLCSTLCDLMDCSTPGFPVHHQLQELAQTQIRWVGDAIQPSHPLPSPSPAFNLSPSDSFPMGQFFASGSQSIGSVASASVLPMNMRDWFTLGLTGLISLQSTRLSSLLQHISSNYTSVVPLDLMICEQKRWVNLLTFTANIQCWVRYR